MFAVLVVLHITVSVLLVISILMQSSKGGGLAGTFGGSSTAFLSGRQAADTLTKATVVLAILFAILSISLNIKSLREPKAEQGIIEKQLEDNGQTAPALPAQ
jgi:preprotein translocase subunit SecG